MTGADEIFLLTWAVLTCSFLGRTRTDIRPDFSPYSFYSTISQDILNPFEVTRLE